MSTMLRSLVIGSILLLLMSCSLPPEQPVTRKMLQGAGVYKAYAIEESPEEVLNALNTEGEVVLKAREGNRPVFVKILATAEGLQVTAYDR